MKTRWTCEKCEKSAIIVHNKYVDVLSMYQFVRENHELISPDCEFDRLKVKVNLEEVVE